MTAMENKFTGKITVSSKAALDIIRHITLSFDGVAQLSTPAKKDELFHMLRGGLNEGGIYITKTKTGLMADIYILAKYGTSAEELRDTLSNKIKTELENYLHMKISKINVHIKGVAVDGT